MSAPPAHADVNPNITVTNLGLIRSDVNGGNSPGVMRVEDVAKLSFDWDASNANPTNGDSFEIGLPAVFDNLEFPQTLPLSVPYQGAPTQIGSCQLTQKQITCTFNEKVDELKGKGFGGFKGSGSALLKAKQTTEQATAEFTVNGVRQQLAIPGGKILEKAAAVYFANRMNKVAGIINAKSNYISWEISFGADYIEQKLKESGQDVTFDGQTRQTFTFVDRLGPGQKFIDNPAEFILMMRNSAQEPDSKGVVVTDAAGTDRSLKYGDFDLKADVDGQTVTFTVSGPFAKQTNYKVYYGVRPATENGLVQQGFKYTNEADLLGTTASARFERYYSQSFSINVKMDPGFGGFDVTKLLSGNAAGKIPQGTTFDVKVKYTLPGNATTDSYPNWQAPGEVKPDKTGGETSYTVTVGQKNTYNGTFPTGTVIELSEDPATVSPATAGVVWGTPVFRAGNSAGERFTIKERVSTAIELTNPVEPGEGTFTVAKTATGYEAAGKQFTFDYQCTDGQSGKLTVPGDGSAVPAGVQFPLGTECTITEDAASAQVDGYDLAAPAAQTVTIQDADTPLAVSFQNAYTRQTGTFTVAKTATGYDAAGKDFDFEFRCDDGQNGRLTAKGDGVAVPAGVQFPLGTECTITEQAASAQVDGYELAAPAAQTVTITDAQTPLAVSFQNAYTRQTGTFTIAKTVTGDGAAATDFFTFSYECTDGSNGLLNVRGDGTPTSSGPLPSGTECTIAEDPSAAEREGYAVESTISQKRVTIGNGTVVAVTANNAYTRETGTFRVVKAVNSDDGADHSGRTFEARYVCTDGSEGTLRLPGDGTPVDGPVLPTGTECTVSENEDGRQIEGYSVATAIDAPTFRIAKDAPVTATITNSYTRQTGGFMIAKNVTGDGAGYAPAEFVFDYQCTDAAGEPTVNGSASVAAGQTVAVEQVPTGSCRLTEQAAPVGNAQLATRLTVDGVPVDGATATVEVRDGATVMIAAENAYTLDRGGFRVVKTVSGDDAEAHAARQFVFDYRCTDGAVGTLSVPGDGTPVAAGDRLPVGTECTVTERGASAQADGYDVVVPPAQTVTIEQKDQTVELSFENRYTRHTGTFQVVKTVTGVEGQDGKEFVFDYRCTDGTAGSLTVRGDGVAVPLGSQLPTGTECTVSEQAASAQIDGYDVVVPPAQTVTIEQKDQTVELSFENRYTRHTGTFQVVKTVTGVEGQDGKEFVFDYRCTDGTAGSLTVRGDGTAVPAGVQLPLGTECTVSEQVASAQIDGYEATVPAAQTVAILQRDQSVELRFENRYVRHTGTFQVVKTVTGVEGQDGKEFVFDYRCTDGTAGSLTVRGDGVAVPLGSQLPTGTECTVSEQADAAQIEGYTVTLPEAQTIRIEQNGQTVELGFENAYAQVPAPTPTPTPEPTPEGTPLPPLSPEATPPAADGGLASTGGEPAGLAALGLAALAAGLAVVLIRRRRA
ncbi:MAG: DUF5979 domain-containing protein [Pseudoclavibacter sp.]|nr:DUF5979 domain-containing protein [Pseudoclavibacter sp.]